MEAVDSEEIEKQFNLNQTVLDDCSEVSNQYESQYESRYENASQSETVTQSESQSEYFPSSDLTLLSRDGEVQEFEDVEYDDDTHEYTHEYTNEYTDESPLSRTMNDKVAITRLFFLIAFFIVVPFVTFLIFSEQVDSSVLWNYYQNRCCVSRYNISHCSVENYCNIFLNNWMYVNGFGKEEVFKSCCYWLADRAKKGGATFCGETCLQFFE